MNETLLSIGVNTESKAKRIAKAKKGFYEILYGLDTKKSYLVFYRPYTNKAVV